MNKILAILIPTAVACSCFVGCSNKNDELSSGVIIYATSESETTAPKSSSTDIMTYQSEVYTESPTEEITEPNTVYEEELPDIVQLCDLPMINEKDLVLKEDVVTDIDRNNYPGGNTYMSRYTSGYFSRYISTVSAEFNLNREYKTIKATLAPDIEFIEGKSSAVELYGDEKLICSYEINQKTEAFTIIEDVSNVKWLKLIIYSLDENGDVQDSNVIIHNPIVFRNDQ